MRRDTGVSRGHSGCAATQASGGRSNRADPSYARLVDAQSVVRIVAPAGDSELAADLLWQAGASAVGFDERDDGTVVLTADVAHPPAEVPSAWNVELLEVDPGEGLDAWREFAQPVRGGRRGVPPPARKRLGQGKSVSVRV